MINGKSGETGLSLIAIRETMMGEEKDPDVSEEHGHGVTGLDPPKWIIISCENGRRGYVRACVCVVCVCLRVCSVPI